MGGESNSITLQLENFRLLQKYISIKKNPWRRRLCRCIPTEPSPSRGMRLQVTSQKGWLYPQVTPGWAGWAAGAAHGGAGTPGDAASPAGPAARHRPRGRAVQLQEKVANPGMFPQFGGCSQRSPGHGEGTAPSSVLPAMGSAPSSGHAPARQTDGRWDGTGGGIICPKPWGAAGTAATRCGDHR